MEPRVVGDGALTRAAVLLMAFGKNELATALNTCCDLDLSYGDSWSDGHDGYIYDVDVLLTTSPEALDTLSDGEALVRRALGHAVSLHRDRVGGLRKGDLTAFRIVAGDVEIDETTLERRRSVAAESDSAALRSLAEQVFRT